jgi:uncharacterized protein (DUF2237 family)
MKAKGLGQVMLKDDRAGGGGRRTAEKVPGDPLDICSIKPMAEFYRDGCFNRRREGMGIALAHCSLFDLKHFAPGLT